MPFRQYALYLLLLIPAVPVTGQELLFRNLSEAGFPSQESYNIMQDSRGYMWVSTETGLCRYSGHALDVFNEKNGLPEQSCYVVKEDERGIMWIATSAGRILNFSNDSLYENAVSRTLRKHYRISDVQVYLMQFAGDTIYWHTPYSSYKTCRSGGRTEPLPMAPAGTDYYLTYRNGTLVPRKGRKEPAAHQLRPDLKIGIEINGRKKQISLPNRKMRLPVWRIMTAMNRTGTSVIAFDNVLIRLNSDLSYKVFYLPNMIVSLYSDPDGGFWAGTYKKGVFYYPDIGHSGHCLNSLADFSVTGTCQDREGGIWCTTLEEGVFYCRSKEVVHYTNIDGLNKKAELLKEVNGRIYTASSTGKLLCIKGGRISNYEVRQYGAYPASDLLPYRRGWLVCTKDALVQTDEAFHTVRNLEMEGTGFHAGGRQLLQLPDGRIFIVYGGSLEELLGTGVVERSNASNYNITCICSGSRKDELLAGTKTGLYRVDTRQFAWRKIADINDHILKIRQSTADETWVITRHSGLLLLKGDSIVPVHWLKQLKTDRFFDVMEDRHHVLWIGCAKGLVRVAGARSKPQIQVYNVTNGLAANEVYNIAADSDYLYLSTVRGISCFPLSADLSNSTAPPVFIRSVSVGDRQLKYNPKQPLFLSWRDHPVRVMADGLSYKEAPLSRLQYLLEGGDNELHSQDGNEIVLGRLSPGSYRLQVFALNSDGKQSADPAVMQFQVYPPFWQTWWFITCSALGIAVLLYGFVSRRIAQVRRKEQEMSRINHMIAEYRLTALQAQMNPHFIFNAINSIQTYILDNQPQVAYDYLAKFSKLIRMVLYHAKDRTLTLEQELKMFRTYTELEQLRFSNKFDVVLDVDLGLDTGRTELPPMLLQPYVENAIWHGLLPLKNTRKGILKVSITKKAEGLKIVIADNGVGRQYHRKETVREHRSQGMMLNEQRMELLSHMPEYKGAAIEVTDLYDPEGAPAGTRVTIHLLLMAGPEADIS